MNNQKQMIAVLMMAALAMTGCAQKENAQNVTTQVEEASTVAVETETKTETGTEEGTEAGQMEKETLSNDQRDMLEMYAFPEDTELWEMRLANTVSNVFCYHDAMICVSETKTYESGKEVGSFTNVTKFIRKDGYVCQESEITGDDGEVTNAHNYYMAENVPGAEFVSVMMDDGFKSLTMFPADEYVIRMDEYWLYKHPGRDAELLGSETDQEGRTTMMTVRTFDEFDEGTMRREFVYTFDEAGFITSVDETDYLDETDEIMNVSHTSVTYDEPQDMHFRAVSDILESQDICDLTVVINPETENEEVQKIQVSKDTHVSFVSCRKSELFSDETCTQPVDGIDVSQDTVTVYVKLGAYY